LSLRIRIRAGSRLAAAPSVERVVEIDPREGVLTIGRRLGNEIELPFAAVSEQHARLARRDLGWLLEDLGSANGTYVNGRRLTPFVAQMVPSGAVLRLADVELAIEGEGESAQGAQGRALPESTATLARRLVSDLFGARRPGEVPRLVVTDGPARGHELHLDGVGRCYRIGRATGCNLVVADDDMSREHAEFERRWDGVFVRDLGSKNGVLCMGERLAAELRLSDGDVLRLGQTTLRLEDPEDRYLRQMQEAEVRAGQAAGADPAASGGEGLANTHTSTQAVGEGVVRRRSTQETRLGPTAAIEGGRRALRHSPLALMVIAALVLAGTIVLALSFVLGN